MVTARQLSLPGGVVGEISISSKFCYYDIESDWRTVTCQKSVLFFMYLDQSAIRKWRNTATCFLKNCFKYFRNSSFFLTKNIVLSYLSIMNSKITILNSKLALTNSSAYRILIIINIHFSAKIPQLLFFFFNFHQF